jgi:hypothetical protein
MMNLHFYDDRVNFLRPLAVGTKCLLSRQSLYHAVVSRASKCRTTCNISTVAFVEEASLNTDGVCNGLTGTYLSFKFLEISNKLVV